MTVEAAPAPGPAAYPAAAGQRSRWIRSRRGAHNVIDPERAYAAFIDVEPAAAGGGAGTVDVATLLLSNRECPWTCLMCDLWRNTLATPTPPGALPRQVARALAELPPASQVKLYNAGSLFDRRAVPVADLPALAELVRDHERVIVECHPRLVGADVLAFRDRLRGRLEVALGLESAHPEILALLNKGMTLEHFHAAAAFLADHDIDMRAFVLVRPPFQDEAAGLEWAKRTLDVAIDAGARTVALIPTRGGNGALEALAATGDFTPPTLASLEAALEHGLARGDAIVTADLWDLDRLMSTEARLVERRARLERMNLEQRILPPIPLPGDGGA